MFALCYGMNCWSNVCACPTFLHPVLCAALSNVGAHTWVEWMFRALDMYLKSFAGTFWGLWSCYTVTNLKTAGLSTLVPPTGILYKYRICKPGFKWTLTSRKIMRDNFAWSRDYHAYYSVRTGPGVCPVSIQWVPEARITGYKSSVTCSSPVF